MANFIPYDRRQQLLLPIDLAEWVPEDDLAHFIIEAVEHVAIGTFKVNCAGTGKAQYHPRMMLALLIYCYAFSSRRIERATYRDLGVRYWRPIGIPITTRSRPSGGRTSRRWPRASCRSCSWPGSRSS